MANRIASCFDKKFIFLCLLVFLHRASANVEIVKEKTLAMIKPDGVDGKYVDVIKKTILGSGFTIIQELELQLDENTVKSFYAEHSTKSFFSSLVQYMTSGPVLIMVLEKENAIADWRALIGPTDASKAKVTHPRSVRALCGVDSQRNCVHGSDSPQSAAREISFFLISHLQTLFQGMMNYKVISAWMAFAQLEHHGSNMIHADGWELSFPYVREALGRLRKNDELNDVLRGVCES